MKKIVRKVALLLIFALIMSGVQPCFVSAAPKKYVKSLSVSKNTISIQVNHSKSLSYKVKVKGTASKKIKVKASNDKVIVTKKNGKIKIGAQKKGTSKITIITNGKGKNGKKLRAVIKVRIIGEKTEPTYQPDVTPAPTASPKVEVTKSEWISTVMKATGYTVQKELFHYDKSGEISYSFVDIAGDENADLIETAKIYGIIPEDSTKFAPKSAADREFVAVTAVRAVGFAKDDWDIDYNDKDNLQYQMEDYIAVQLHLLALSDNQFLPKQTVTKEEKKNAEKILSDIIEGREVDIKHEDSIDYSEDVEQKEDVTDYTVVEQDGQYIVTVPEGTSLDGVSDGDKIVLPAIDSYVDGMAMVVSSNTVSADGDSRVVTGTVPEEISEFVDSVDIEGMAEVDADGITAEDGVAVEVSAIDGTEKSGKISTNKGKKIDGEINLEKHTKVTYTIKEIETTVSFYISALKYNIDFDKKGVKELYIGLPNVLSMDTNYKKSKEFSKKLGEIPIKIAAGFSANIEVYLEAGIDGEIKMNLKLSNEVGVQYCNGELIAIKNCEPSFDLVVDADAEVGAKLQLGLYWMKGIQEVFGKEDPRPIYNVYTRWGLHGDATLHIRNDKDTSYENLTCIDLGYYLYGTVDVGKGSFLGDTFNLTHEWVIFDDKNSPLKGALHIENGEVIALCTYQADTGTENEYTILRFWGDNIEESYQGTTYHCSIASDGDITLYVEYKDKKVKINTENQYGVAILTNGETVYYSYTNPSQKVTVYEVDLASGNKTVAFFEDTVIDYSLQLVGCYNDCLYYIKPTGIDTGTLYKYDMRKEKRTNLLENVPSAVPYGKYLIVEPYTEEYWWHDLKSFDMVNEKAILLSDKALDYKVIDSKLYMVIYKRAYGDKNSNPMEDCICDVVTCDLDGKNAVKLLSDVRVRGYITEITETYVKTRIWNWNDDTHQDFILNYTSYDDTVYDVLLNKEKVLQAYGKILLEENNLNEDEDDIKPYFSICDINADGVLDFILSEGKHILSSKKYYTYENGNVVAIEEPDEMYPAFGDLYLIPSRGTYAFYRGGPATTDKDGNGYMPRMILEYKLENHAIRLANFLNMLAYQSGEKAGENEYYWNGEQCTAEEYQSVYNSFDNRIIFYPNSETNRLYWGIK